MSRHFDAELIEQIKDANDIVSVISEHMTLKKMGRNYWGCCPFHNEKTPSFSVNPEKGFFYCFGCRETGNAISFLMKYNGVSFPEALEQLANRAGIVLPERNLSKAELVRKEHRDKLYKVNELAATFFHNCLTKTEMGKPGLAYLQGRGLSAETIEHFQLGFAPNNWDKLYRSFHERGIDDQLLIESGLCRRNEAGKLYDYFRNRVMFPICDGKGRVVAFGGRVLDDSKPKYLNSPEYELFNKGHMLFAFDKAYRTIREKKQVILVEGYMDVIGAHNQGITNVVASLGTAYTKDQGRLLIRQAEEVVLAYDMDNAGQIAARRAIELLQDTEFKVRVVAMPDGKDPDDYVRNHGSEAFLELVANAVTPFEFYLNSALISHDSNTVNGKEAILEEVFPLISATSNQIERENYLKALALPLWMDNSTIYRMFRQYLGKGDITLPKVTAGTTASVGTIGEEDKLVAIALTDPLAWQRVQAYLPLEDITNPLYQALFKKAGDILSKTGSLQATALEESLTEEERSAYGRLMVMGETEFNEAQLDGYIRAVRLKSLREQYKTHSVLADQLNRAGDTRFVEELKMCQDLQTLIKEWT
ncbi:DNA primase [Veillonella sp. R32]|uniref:DNA primase n=1 Tax=Veillonella sp. R32 TaxID=2021312 RepID=UPI0013899FF3|nr:DNA primase [Veillonella sp. R32]KAF1682216.1 DNA primase [Veillonella sp. R32]